jgi:hypothetical protein
MVYCRVVAQGEDQRPLPRRECHRDTRVLFAQDIGLSITYGQYRYQALLFGESLLLYTNTTGYDILQ